MLSTVLVSLSKIGSLIKELLPIIAAFFAGKLKEQNEQLEQQNVEIINQADEYKRTTEIFTNPDNIPDDILRIKGDGGSKPS